MTVTKKKPLLMELGYATASLKEEVEEESFSSSDDGGDFDEPPVISPPHTMNIPSVRRPPVPVMVLADRVSTHVLPLAPLAVVDRELFHSYSLIKINRDIAVSITAMSE